LGFFVKGGAREKQTPREVHMKKNVWKKGGQGTGLPDSI
jgi:hypothetical protein